jgi:hypothetical protein
MNELIAGQEYQANPELIESLKPKVADFVTEALPWFGPQLSNIENFRIVDEFGFCLTGISLFGPELIVGRIKGAPNIDIAIKPDVYRTPKPPEEHPVFIQLPYPVFMLIHKAYGLSVYKFIKATPELLAIPTVKVDLGKKTSVLVPEPVGHIRHFAKGTILNPKHTVQTTPEDRFQEWFKKLRMLHQIGRQIGRQEVADTAFEMINQSTARWEIQNWDWLIGRS